MRDSLKYAKMLEVSGFSRKQAEVQVRILGTVIGEEMFTKENLKTLELNTQNDFGVLKTELHVVKTDLNSVKDDVANLKTDVSTLKNDVSSLKSDVSVLKSDVGVLKKDVSFLKEEFNSFKTKFKEDIYAKLTDEIQKSEYRMVIKLGSTMAALMTAGLTALKLLGG